MKKIMLAAIIALSTNGTFAAETCDESTLSSIKKGVTDSLKDPFSAQFRKIKLIKYIDDKGQEAMLAVGEVNAKNSYGGYVGFRDFGVSVLSTPKGPFSFLPLFAGSPTQSQIFQSMYGRHVKTGTVACEQQD